MIKVKLEKIIIISFIGLIGIFLAGLSGNIVSKAGQPESTSGPAVNIEERLHDLSAQLEAGKITKQTYDSLSGILRAQVRNMEAVADENHPLEKMPEWVSKLGIKDPEGMKLDLDFSSYTSVNNPSEGFNSVSLIYKGDYETAVREATKMADTLKLAVGGNFEAKGNPREKMLPTHVGMLKFLNYSLENTDKDFLISVQVDPAGRLTLSVTDNRQLNARLLAYAPLNNRYHSVAKQKKQ